MIEYIDRAVSEKVSYFYITRNFKKVSSQQFPLYHHNKSTRTFKKIQSAIFTGLMETCTLINKWKFFLDVYILLGCF